MRYIEYLVGNSGYVSNYRFSDNEKADAYSLVVYLRPGACRSVENRKQALENLKTKIEVLSGVESVDIGLIGTGKQQYGYMGSLTLNTA